MGWLWIFLVIVVASAIPFIWRYRNWKGDDRLSQILAGSAITTLGSSAVIFLFVFIFAATDEGQYDRHCKTTEHRVDIISNTLNQTSSGPFVLGFNGTHYYTYVSTDHGLKLVSFPASKTYVTKGSAKPHYSREDKLCERRFRNWVWPGTTEPVLRTGSHGQLHVPENTLLKDLGYK